MSVPFTVGVIWEVLFNDPDDGLQTDSILSIFVVARFIGEEVALFEWMCIAGHGNSYGAFMNIQIGTNAVAGSMPERYEE